jgi:ABC-2 type transport system permease protein
MSYLQLLGLFFRLSLLNELQYRTNFWLQLIQSLLGLGLALGGLAVIFEHTAALGGWQPAELVALVGVYTLVSGLIASIIQPGLQQFMEDVRLGTFDFILIKPIDSQFLLTVRYIQIWELTDVALGLSVLLVALHDLAVTITVWHVVAFIVTLLAGGIIVYSFWLILATFSFWFVRLEDLLAIFQSMYQAGRWPISIYPLWLRAVLTFVVPIAFAITVPTEALIGRLTGSTFLSTVALAAGLFMASRWFWKLGLMNYTGAST